MWQLFWNWCKKRWWKVYCALEVSMLTPSWQAYAYVASWRWVFIHGAAYMCGCVCAENVLYSVLPAQKPSSYFKNQGLIPMIGNHKKCYPCDNLRLTIAVNSHCHSPPLYGFLLLHEEKDTLYLFSLLEEKHIKQRKYVCKKKNLKRKKYRN